MGMHLSTYVGPYLKVPGVQDIKKVTSFTCAPGCRQKHQRKTTPFCSSCGQPIVEHTQNIQALCTFDLDDLDPKFEELLTQCLTEDKHPNAASFWIANTIRIGKTFTEYDGDEAYELDATSIQSQCTKFAAHYADLIQAIKDQYNVEPKVCFGVISEMQ